MGFLSYALAGVGFLLVGTFSALFSSSLSLNSTKLKVPLSSSSSIKFSTISGLCFFFLLNSLISLIDANNSSDQIGLFLQLQVITVVSLFFLYSILGILTNFQNLFHLPPPLHNLALLFAFGEEFLLFYLQRKDPTGIENRYYDLLLLPISICFLSTIFELRFESSSYPVLGRAIGLILQGTWFIQMGFSFFTDSIAHGCYLYVKSRGNYTIKCQGHPEYHRGRAIATLQFNCHMAFLVIISVGLLSVLSKQRADRESFLPYKPLGTELHQFEDQSPMEEEGWELNTNPSHK